MVHWESMNQTFLCAAALSKKGFKAFCASFFKKYYPICLKGLGSEKRIQILSFS